MAKGGSKFIMCIELGYGKGSRKARRVTEGKVKAVAGVEDAALCPAEGEVAKADMEEGGLGGGGGSGREWCEVGDSSGIRGTEQVLVGVRG